MKKSIKAITAALSAAVLCALPIANAFTASAFNPTNKRYKITYMSTKLNCGYQNVNLRANKASGMNFSTLSLGRINGGRLGGGGYVNNDPNKRYNLWYTSNNNGLNEIGIVANWFITTTNSNRNIDNISGSTGCTYLKAIKVRMGDLTGAVTGEEDGLDVSDAVALSKLAHDSYYNGVITHDINAYLHSMNYDDLDQGLINMMLAGDINGDYLLTENEVIILQRHYNSFNGYTNLGTFYSMSDAQLGTYIANH